MTDDAREKVVEAVANEIADAIIDDITDRKGLRQVWDNFDDDVLTEIRNGFIEIIVARADSLGYRAGEDMRMVPGDRTVREIALAAMIEMRQQGESFEMCARWISERVHAAASPLAPSPESGWTPRLGEHVRVKGNRNYHIDWQGATMIVCGLNVEADGRVAVTTAETFPPKERGHRTNGWYCDEIEPVPPPAEETKT